MEPISNKWAIAIDGGGGDYATEIFLWETMKEHGLTKHDFLGFWVSTTTTPYTTEMSQVINVTKVIRKRIPNIKIFIMKISDLVEL